MATDIYMPQLGLTMTEGTVVRWLKAEGDPVKKGQPVLEIETDKVTMEIEAPADGVLGPILVEAGRAVPIGAPLSHVLAPGETAPTAPEAAPAPTAAGRPAPPSEPGKGEQAAGGRAGGRLMATPRARRVAYELGIDLTQVEASGPGGRIVEADVRWYADRVKAAPPQRISPVARRLADELEVDLTQVEGTGPGGRIVKMDVQRAAGPAPVSPAPTPATARPGQVEPLQGIRRVVAERMTHSFTTTPHFYLSVEVEATALTRMREGLLPKVEASTGVRLTITDILVKVCAQALSEFPEVNVAWVEATEAEDSGLLRQPEVNVGVAVGLDQGLVVPVIRQADRLTLSQIAQRRTDLVARARSGKLSLPDLEGGTFTLSNLGMFGIDQFHAIINSPQSAILAVGRIRERPVALDGAVVVRPVMHLTLSVDHRPLDGMQGARFLERVSQLIEEPYLLLA